MAPGVHDTDHTHEARQHHEIDREWKMRHNRAAKLIPDSRKRVRIGRYAFEGDIYQRNEAASRLKGSRRVPFCRLGQLRFSERAEK